MPSIRQDPARSNHSPAQQDAVDLQSRAGRLEDAVAGALGAAPRGSSRSPSTRRKGGTAQRTPGTVRDHMPIADRRIWCDAVAEREAGEFVNGFASSARTRACGSVSMKPGTNNLTAPLDLDRAAIVAFTLPTMQSLAISDVAPGRAGPMATMEVTRRPWHQVRSRAKARVPARRRARERRWRRSCGILREVRGKSVRHCLRPAAPAQ